MRLWFLLPLMFLMACNASKMNQVPVLHGDFTITEIEGLEQVPEGVSISFDSSENGMSGNAGCNRYFGKYTQEGNKLTLQAVGVSQKMCFDESIMKAEDKLLSILGDATSFTLKDDVLTVKGEKKNTLFVAQRMTAKSSEAGTAEEAYVLEYHTQSMIKEQTIEVRGDKMSCFVNGNSTDMQLSSADVEAFASAFNALDLEGLKTLEAPSEQRHLDAAAYARFKVHTNGMTYETPSFDHGNPPAAIAKIVTMITDKQVCPQ